jgi:hypothetical protein
MTGTSLKHPTISRGNRRTTFRSVDTRTGIRTRSDQSLTSGAFPSAVRVSPRAGKVVRPYGSQRDPHPNTAPGTLDALVLVTASGPSSGDVAAGCPTQTPPSQGAYGDGLTGLVRVGPLGTAPGMSKLVEVHFLEVVTRGESAVLALRWEATGPGGRPFPALDADMSLTPAGEHSTRLSLAGSTGLRTLLSARAWDRAVFHRMADATVGPRWPASRTFSPALRGRPAPCREPT